MNLHKIASSVINAVNPNRVCQVQASDGYKVGPDGTPIPQYLPPVQAYGQVQQLSTRDLQHLEALNVQGSMRKIYISGSINAISRINQFGGDLIVLSDNTVWLTTQVLEMWPDWCAVAVTLQDGS